MKSVRKVLVVLIAVTIIFSFAFAVSCRQVSDGNQNTIQHGSKLLKQSYIDSIQATAFQYEHIKSGAKLFYLKTGDENKVFSIIIRTPPNDNTGVNMIGI